MSLGYVCVTKEILHVKEKNFTQNLIQKAYDIYEEHNYHVRDIIWEEIDLCEEDIGLEVVLQREYDVCDEDISMNKEFNLSCVKEEVVQMEDDVYESGGQCNLIQKRNHFKDIHIKEEIIEKIHVKEPDDACGVSSTATLQGLYKEHIVKDEFVIGPDVLQLREVTYTTDGLNREHLPNNEEIVHMEDECENVEIKEEPDDDACGVSEVTLGLYEEHTVKNELVMDEVLQQVMTYTADKAATGEGRIKMEVDEHEEVHIKEERDDDACGVSEEATLESLYKEHVVKDELVIGPEVLQPRDAIYMADASAAADVKHGVFYSCKNCRELLTTEQSDDHACVLYFCDICNKIIGKKNQMTIHKKVHAVKKPYKCEVCGESFVSKNCLIPHLRKHNGEEPFTCEICRKQFKRWHFFKYHMVAASCQMPSETEICHKSKDLATRIIWRQDWKTYVDTLCERLSGALIALRKIAPLIAGDALKKVYYAHFHSLMSHGTLVWGNTTYAERVLSLQIQAVRILVGEQQAKSAERSLVGEQQAESVERSLVGEQQAESAERILVGEQQAESAERILVGEQQAESAERILVGEQQAESAERILVGEQQAESAERILVGKQQAESAERILVGEQQAESAERILVGEQQAESAERILVGEQQAESAERILVGERQAESAERILVGERQAESAERILVGERQAESAERILVGERQAESAERILVGERQAESAERSTDDRPLSRESGNADLPAAPELRRSQRSRKSRPTWRKRQSRPSWRSRPSEQPEHPSKQLFISQRIMTHYSQYLFDLLLYVRKNISKFARIKPGRLRTVCAKKALTGKNPRVIGPYFYERLPDDLKNELSEETFRLRLSNILLDNPLYSVCEYIDLVKKKPAKCDSESRTEGSVQIVQKYYAKNT